MQLPEVIILEADLELDKSRKNKVLYQLRSVTIDRKIKKPNENEVNKEGKVKPRLF